MKLTKEQAIAEHRKMWRWIAEETEKQKRCITKLKYCLLHLRNRSEFPLHECFCCEYDYCTDNNNMCQSCPIDWGVCATELMCEYGLFGQWHTAVKNHNYEMAAELARRIAELPERSI